MSTLLVDYMFLSNYNDDSARGDKSGRMRRLGVTMSPCRSTSAVRAGARPLKGVVRRGVGRGKCGVGGMAVGINASCGTIKRTLDSNDTSVNFVSNTACIVCSGSISMLLATLHRNVSGSAASLSI